jgi:hypothetical protein
VKSTYELSEGALRYLCRIAEQMRQGATGEIVIVLHEGGVRDFRESRSVRANELEESDEALIREIARRS